MGDHPLPLPSDPAPSQPAASASTALVSPAGARTARRVLLVLLTLSIIVSGFAYVQFSRSEESILVDLKAIHEKGKTLAVDACLDEVLDWHQNRCTAMTSLCERSVGRLMEQCLAGRDRADYCSHVDTTGLVTLNPKTGRPTEFGDADCDARAGKSRSLRKQCGTAYRAIAYYCGQVQKHTAAVLASGVAP